MPKGMQSNKEAKKPKKERTPAPPPGTMGQPIAPKGAGTKRK